MNPHRVFAQQGEPPWDAEPRFELGSALQQADALPTELRRIKSGTDGEQKVLRIRGGQREQRIQRKIYGARIQSENKGFSKGRHQEAEGTRSRKNQGELSTR